MNVLVDTPIWSQALRKQDSIHPPSQNSLALEKLIREGCACLIGPVRQEVLSGICDNNQFENLCQHLKYFQNYSPLLDDYETAARFFNVCRSKGIQGSHTDFLICAMAIRNQWPIFTTDQDFFQYAKHLPLRIWPGITSGGLTGV